MRHPAPLEDRSQQGEQRLTSLVLTLVLHLALLLAKAAALFLWPQRSAHRRILHLCSGSIAQAFERNGLGLYTERECSDFQGFFEHVYAVSFPSPGGATLALTSRHTLFDYDLSPRALKMVPRPMRSIVRLVAFIWWAASFVRRNKISIVQATDPYFRGLAALIVARVTRIPYGILGTRDYDLDYDLIGKLAMNGALPTRAVEKVIERFVFQHADVALADRAFYARYALRNGASPARVARSWVLADTAYLGEPSARSDPRLELDLESKRVLIYAGRLDPEKYVDDAVRCLALVRDRGHDAYLILAGRGMLEENLAGLARELGVERFVHFLGTQSAERLAALFAHSDVIVGTHMGYTLVEGALSGTPIVAYDYEWHPEVVHHGETGILVPLRDHRTMAEWVSRLLNDPALARRLGSTARAFALREHDWGRAMARYREIYSRVLAGEHVT